MERALSWWKERTLIFTFRLTFKNERACMGTVFLHEGCVHEYSWFCWECLSCHDTFLPWENSKAGQEPSRSLIICIQYRVSQIYILRFPQEKRQSLHMSCYVVYNNCHSSALVLPQSTWSLKEKKKKKHVLLHDQTIHGCTPGLKFP